MKAGYIIVKVYTILFLFFCFACQKHEIPGNRIDRTIIVYMAADNDLYADALENIEEMKQGFSETGVRLIVFIDPADDAPNVLEITPGGSKTVKIYPEFNSADATQMGQVLNDITNMYPALEFGLILWSHSTSWLPAGSMLRSFGDDSTNVMLLSNHY